MLQRRCCTTLRSGSVAGWVGSGRGASVTPEVSFVMQQAVRARWAFLRPPSLPRCPTQRKRESILILPGPPPFGKDLVPRCSNFPHPITMRSFLVASALRVCEGRRRGPWRTIIASGSKALVFGLKCGAVAQLVERIVRNDEVACSTHVRSTSPSRWQNAEGGRRWSGLHARLPAEMSVRLSQRVGSGSQDSIRHPARVARKPG